jgi:hypothetical protein
MPSLVPWDCPACGFNSKPEAAYCMRCGCPRSGGARALGRNRSTKRRAALPLGLLAVGVAAVAAVPFLPKEPAAGPSLVYAGSPEDPNLSAAGGVLLAPATQAPPAAPPATVAPAVEKPKGSPARAPSPSPSVLHVTPEPALPPSAPVLVAPRVRQVPPAPAVTQSIGIPPKPAPPVIQSVSRPPDPGLPVSGGWMEKPSDVETPEIRILNQTTDDSSGEVVFADRVRIYRLKIGRGVSRMSLPAGEYQYTLYASRYQKIGEPDQVGTLTCRKFRFYEIPFLTSSQTETIRKDLGDAPQ